MVLPDIIKVVIDYGWAPLRRRHLIDTGGWVPIIRRTQVIDKPSNSFNLKLEVKGKAIKKSLLPKF